jgi:hypothetical protein
LIVILLDRYFALQNAMFAGVLHFPRRTFGSLVEDRRSLQVPLALEEFELDQQSSHAPLSAFLTQ